MSVKEQFDPTNYGIFAGSEGLANVSEMDVSQADDYYAMSRHCEGCGQRKECRIDWAELYCLQYGINPADVGRTTRRTDIFDTNWRYDPAFHCYHPNYRCTCHGNPLVLFNMTPREAERVLHGAGRNGIISSTQTDIIRQIAPLVKRMSGQPVPVQSPPPAMARQGGPGMVRR